jgi:hypothetical protein
LHFNTTVTEDSAENLPMAVSNTFEV